jgi:hypothetical protein
MINHKRKIIVVSHELAHIFREGKGKVVSVLN